MPSIKVTYQDETREAQTEAGTLLANAVKATGFPLEQPCAGRGTCGKCKVMAQGGVAPPDEVEASELTQAEQDSGYRLACRARVARSGDRPQQIEGDGLQQIEVVLPTLIVFSNKIFTHSTAFRKQDDPLGLAIDLGSTTVAAFLTSLETGTVYAGAATLNQQTMFGADVISRLNAAMDGDSLVDRLADLALASIGQAIDGLLLSRKIQQRIQKAVVVGNTAMHHLLVRLPVESLGLMPFQPYDAAPIHGADGRMAGSFPSSAEVHLPPLIGGFVGSDALACLAAFDFDKASAPMAAIDLGTNGEVMVTDGERILTTSTAAGPAFEGVNIACGARAAAGAIVATEAHKDGTIEWQTIGDEAPIGIAGTGLLSLVHELRQVSVVEDSGRMRPDRPAFADRIRETDHGRRLHLTEDVYLSQWDARELQKAKGAIRAACDILLRRLDLAPEDLQRVILTGSFGGQMDIDAIIGVGMIPPVRSGVVETAANGAGMGAALFLDDAGFARGEALATHAEHVELDLEPDFNERFIEAMTFE
ncbi:MAG: Na(+)-translocating NADH-quinone reductase subunit F [Anaerolineales bacterium]|nr:Na(+)-translocating NADH-quinone reductase subunit F [Anaerolineales bacterium]